MRNQILLENLVVESYANEGKCIAHHEGKVVFVKGTLPGEVVYARVTKSKKDWMEAEVSDVIQSSADRQLPFCQHFGYCGGCQWQHMKYEAQLRYKEQAAIETLERLGKISIKEKLPIVGCDADRGYRNKLEFTFSHREWQVGEAFRNNTERIEYPAVGYHFPKYFDRVFDVKECHLMPEPSDRIRLATKKFCVENGYEFFNLIKQTGLMRNIIIRMTTTGEVMLLVVFAQNDEEKIRMLMEFLRQEFPEIISLQYTINAKKNDTIYDLSIITHSGSDAIYERIGRLKFRISAKSFFQTNTRQTEKLYECVKEFAALSGNELVYDFYSGTGSIAMYIADGCRKVIGIESVAQAIEDAKVNAAINDIQNVSFHVADISKIFTGEFYSEHGTPDVVITDPPRTGMHPDVVKELLQMQPMKIVYVSCNVATQARDLQMLSGKYSVERIRPLDLFPQTHHVENVAELKLI
ncbi:MAG TPA: 23S rRNA (uracil(1939)-C(5))-methyltransferase RlmD [Chitinophagales bacterium]|nr:23S rRNA (uracil(1939)-C(5))-methyltransferase RlmD [Chitinophagales bacterium]